MKIKGSGNLGPLATCLEDRNLGSCEDEARQSISSPQYSDILETFVSLNMTIGLLKQSTTKEMRIFPKISYSEKEKLQFKGKLISAQIDILHQSSTLSDL